MWNEIAPDEKRVFNGPSTAVRGSRTVHLAPGGAVKLFTFACFRPDVATEVREAMLAAHVEASMQSADFGVRLSGFTTTRARQHDAASQMDAKPQTASNRDIVFIHHFADDAAARSAMLSTDYVDMLRAQSAFLDDDSRITILSHGWILKQD
jgi:hypothetical protein